VPVQDPKEQQMTMSVSWMPRMTAVTALFLILLVACGGGSFGCGGASLGADAQTKIDPRFEADVPPAIVFHPHSLMVKEGESAMFGVMGGLSPLLRYQWRRNGVDIPGATQDHLVLGAASLADDGAQYDVVITNAAGQAVSRPGVLAVVSAQTDLPWR
jgi:hypothetical protein